MSQFHESVVDAVKALTCLEAHPNQLLMCHLHGAFCTESSTVHLVLKAGDCCDMEGSIKFAEVLSSSKKLVFIQSWSGRNRDIIYVKKPDGNWYAVAIKQVR